MLKKNWYNTDIKVTQTLVGILSTSTTDINCTGVDGRGYGSVIHQVTLGDSADTLSGSLMVELELEESDDDNTYTDCAIKGTAGSPTATWADLDHLEGETVAIRADDIPQPPEVVTGGEITLARTASSVEIGLPLTMRVKLLPPEVSGGAGVVKGSAVSVNQVFVEVLDTIGLTIDGQKVAFRQFGEDVLDTPIEPFTGIKEVQSYGWEISGGAIEIVHDDPLPCNVLAVVRKVSVNEG